MSMNIHIKKVDNHTIKLDGVLSTATSEHLHKYFSYRHEKNAAQQKKRMGFVETTYLYNKKKQTLPIMFLYDVCYLLKANNIPYTVDKSLQDVNKPDWVEKTYTDFLKRDFSNDFTPHEHQTKAIRALLTRKKGFAEMATSSGKSFVIYCIACSLALQGKKILILTDTTTLTEQLKNDILDYSKNSQYWDRCVKTIYSGSGHDKYDPEGKIFISTYQSMKEPADYFRQFHCIIVDEAHRAIADSIIEIINKCWHCEYRIGMSGRLSDTKEHKWKTTALFGHVMHIINAKELIALGLATPLRIEMIRLNHTHNPEFAEYKDYIDYLIADKSRLRVMVNDALLIKQNMIILFNRIAYGKRLFKALKEADKNNDFIIEYIDGAVKVDERIRIKELYKEHNNVILVASYKTISTGINAPNLRGIMMAEPMKADLTIVQSIGRILRKSKDKDEALLFDYSDSYGWGKYHAQLRKKIYQAEHHDYSNKEMIVNSEL